MSPPRIQSRIMPRILVVALSVGVSLAACTSKPSAESQQAISAITLDRPVFHFDYKRATSLTIAKSDPASGDHWEARFERQQDNAAAFYDGDPWVIRSYSENGSLPDRLANRTLILHLLDTLSTLHPIERASDGAGENVRASYGLTPPRYALRWEVREPEEKQPKSFQVEIGGLVNSGSDSDRVAYGVFPPDTTIYKLDGAALPMLEYVKKFSVIRQETLSPLSSDDVDEIEIRQNGAKTFYAQRDGDLWSDAHHHPWKKRDVQGFLDRITHLRIENFVDAGAEAAPLRTVLERKSVTEITLIDRYSKPTKLRLARQGERALAEISSRPGAVFVLYPGALSKLEP